MAIIAEHATLFIFLACGFGIFMAWGIGANDVANAMGTSVGSKALTVKQAIIIAIIFEFLGAYFAGGEVTSTIRKGIIDPAYLTENPEYLVYGMLAALLAAAIWLLIATSMGWPVSTTHSIVGAIVGFAVVALGFDAVKWSKVGTIAASWVVSPVLAGIISFLLFRSVQRLILDTADPFQNAKRYVPLYMYLMGFMVAMVTMTKGLKHLGIGFTFFQSVYFSLAIGLAVVLVGVLFLRRISPTATDTVSYQAGQSRYADVERIFAILMIFTACSMAFAHGSNDVANAVGPIAAVVSVVNSSGEILAKSRMPGWILLLGGIGIVSGLALYGYRVIATIGKKITHLTPSSGFAAELGAAMTVVLASGTGLPVSTTHTLVGAILGVGLARGIGALNLNVVGNIFVSWIVTLPAGALLAALFFFAFRAYFS